MRDTLTLSSWFHFPFYSRGPNRHCLSKLLPRHRPARHILRSSALPLCSIHGCRFCHYSRLCALIPFVYRIHLTQHLNKNPLRRNICRRKPHILPPALPRLGWYASSILRLPRCLHTMKFRLFNRVPNLSCRRHHVPLHPMRSIRC